MNETPRLIVDVTQFVHWPAATGVQRVLHHLAGRWSGDELRASYGFLQDRSYVVGPIADLAPVVRLQFERGLGPVDARSAEAEPVRTALTRTADGLVPVDRLATGFEAYLLPEPTLRTETLSLLTRLAGSDEVVPFVLYYDALPLAHPELHPRTADAGGVVTRYHCVAGDIDNVAFISESARRFFETRIARRSAPRSLVARPGADGLPAIVHEPAYPPVFTAVGTVEPRKRYGVLLDAFEALWSRGRDYELLVVGARGSESAALLERLQRLSWSMPLRWIEQADDRGVASALSRSSALVFLSESEGYGLPPLEALAVGCPVIVSSALPALEGLGNAGQIRLESATVDELSSAIDFLADPEHNRALRQAIRQLKLPTWSQFTMEIEYWIASVLAS